MRELWQLSALEVIDLLREGQVTSLDLIEIARERIKALEPEINAIPILCWDRAKDKAAAMIHPETPGPGYLYGLPIVVKDSAAVSGVQWTMGSRIFKGRQAVADDPQVEVLERNGAIIIGKSNMPEFGAGANTYNDVFGETRNPWDISCTCGGSSGGTAAALAAGEVWLGTGGDLGGSLRIPASFCGVVGIRPSVGRVPQAFTRASLLKTVSGPMARNVPDLALMLDAMSFQHPRDPESLPAPDISFQQHLRETFLAQQLKIAWSPDLGGISPMEPQVATTCRGAVDWFASQGSQVTCACPDLSDAEEIFQTLRADQYSRDCAYLMQDPILRDMLKPEMQWQIAHGMAQTDEQVRRAETALLALQARVNAFLEDFDVFCSPCVMTQPFDIKTSNKGLPIGLQMIARRGQDAQILAAAAFYEKTHGFSNDVPLRM